MTQQPMSQLAKRLSVSAVLITVCTYTIFFAPAWLFLTIVEVFSLLALHEYFELAAKKNLTINRFLGLFFGLLIPLSISSSSESVVLASACVVLFVSNFYSKEKDQALLSTSATVFGLIYVSWFFAHVLKIKTLPAGSAWVFYTILLVKGGDAGAYFVGRKYGKTKLIPHISPNKSVEGSIACVGTTLLLSLISKLYLPQASFLHLSVMGLGLGILSQFGDLAESQLKREAGVKDSGQIPGLGGILDVLDSLILTVPFVYYYVLYFVLKVPL